MEWKDNQSRIMEAQLAFFYDQDSSCFSKERFTGSITLFVEVFCWLN